MLEAETFRRCMELVRSEESLREVWDLLDTPNFAPFICLKRGRRTTMRVNLWGGRRTLFGYEHFHVGACPWCLEVGQYTVRHIFRDCCALENDRRIVFTEAAAYLRQHNLKNVCGIDGEDREHWYRLMAGASVDNHKISLQLNTATHFNRPPTQAATRHMRENLSVYRGVMGVLDGFFQATVLATNYRLDELVDVARSPPRGLRVPRVNHRNVPLAMLISDRFHVAAMRQPPPLLTVSTGQHGTTTADNDDVEFDPTAPRMTMSLPGLDNYINWYDGVTEPE